MDAYSRDILAGRIPAIADKKADDYREEFWYSLDVYPKSWSKSSRQKRLYAKRKNNAGRRMFTLREIAQAKGRSFRRYVADNVNGLDDYLDNDYHYLFIDIDSKVDRGYIRYDQMQDMVSRFRSRQFPEVYVSKSASTDVLPWRYHLFIRTREPFYYREVLGEGVRRSRQNDFVKCEKDMTDLFLAVFMRCFQRELNDKTLAPADSSLYSIHCVLQSAPDDSGITKPRRSVLEGTTIGHIVTKAKQRARPNIPEEYDNAVDYPCCATERYKAWHTSFLPVSFDLKLPSATYGSEIRKVQDGKRHAYADRLAEDIWTAVKFNEKHYTQYAMPYRAEDVVRKVMYEFCYGANTTGCAWKHIERMVAYRIACLDQSWSDVDDFIAATSRFHEAYTRRRKDGSTITVDDPYCIRRRDRCSKDHADNVIVRLREEGIIKRSRLTIDGSQLDDVLRKNHVTMNALKKRGIKTMSSRTAKRSDTGKTHRETSIWGDYLARCPLTKDDVRRVPYFIGAEAAFRKYCSRHQIRYRVDYLADGEIIKLPCLPVPMPIFGDGLEDWQREALSEAS